ncbi:hypothetical protein PPRY_a3313 [Pseudoalteromonas prydzensis ACAM 620]|nr:hypothetical protein [Pseudoalteromonas prydzensis ACAM 620]
MYLLNVSLVAKRFFMFSFGLFMGTWLFLFKNFCIQSFTVPSF